MGIDKITLALAKKFTTETVEGGGAIKGKNCTVKSITDITGGHRVTFEWTLDDGTVQTGTMDVMDGADGKGIASVAVNEQSHLIITYTDGTTTDAGAIEVHSAVDSVNGKTGNVTLTASDVGALPDDTPIPSKTSDLTNDSDFAVDANYVHTDNNYDATAKEIVDGVTDALTGKVDKVDGKGLSTEDYTSEEKTKLADVEAGAEVNTIESITLNGTEVTPDANKNVALTVITKAVNDLVNYYLKSETYSKTEVDGIVTAIKNGRFEAVDTLPTTDIKTNVIYLVPKNPTQTSNVKDEYINLDGTTAGYEKIGDTEIDLSDYVTTQALNTALADYTTTTDLTTLLAGKQDTLTFDNVPTENSDNPVKSGGVFKAIDDAVKALDVTDAAVTGSYVTAVSETDGKIAVTRVEADSVPTQNSPKAVKSNGVYVANNTIYSVMGINGAKNLVDIPDFTLIKDTYRTKSVSIRALPKRPYICSFDVTDASDPINGQVQVFDINNYAVGGVTITKNGHYSFPVSADHDDYRNIYAYINSTLADGTTMKISNFMIRLASDTDDTYEPYAKTNQELTAEVSSLKEDLWDANSILGAKNLAPHLVSQIINGVTFTVNDDGSITVNGTATSDCWYDICGQDINNFLQAGENYIVSGCPEGGSDTTFFMYIGGSYLKYVLNDTSFTCDAAKSGHFYICVRTNTVMDNVVFYPMIRLASDIDSTYQPYAKTNQQLTQETNALDPILNKLGAKNLLRFDLDIIKAINPWGIWNGNSYTYYGVTYTINDDNSITVNGTNTGEQTSPLFLARVSDHPITLSKGDYILSGAPEGGAANTYCMYLVSTTSNYYRDIGNGKKISIEANDSVFGVTLFVDKNITVNNLKFYPMLRYASIADDTYAPYAKSNKELTEEIVAINADNAGAHNSIYRGKYLGSSVTAEQYAAISSGKFTDLYIGDYWTIGGVNYRIAAFDYWLHTGNTECTTHHIVIVPDSTIANGKMNNTNTTTGGYVGSDFYTGNNENTAFATAKSVVNNAFGSSHILNHREYLINEVTDGHSSAGAWYDSTLELMNEQMVYGTKILEPSGDGSRLFINYTIDTSQLPLFRYDHSLICIREDWWLRNVITGSIFADVHGSCNAGSYSASYSIGIRPAFAIKA